MEPARTPAARWKKKPKSENKGEACFALVLFNFMRFRLLSVSLSALLLLLALSACSPAAVPTSAPFIPPAAQPLPVSTFQPATTQPLALPTHTAVTASPAEPSLTAFPIGPCTDGLTFDEDITIPDGTIVQPGALVDKQWRVSNSGTCDWDSSYSLKHVGGDPLGAAPEQALFPARAGSQTVLRIVFTAPYEAGLYQTSWQAFAPDGTVFGDAVYMSITISP